MFSQTNSDITGFDSTWKTEKESSDGTTQTMGITTKESTTNTSCFENIGCQTETTHKKPAAASDEELARMSVWLQKMCPKVLHELERDDNTQAFRNYPGGETETLDKEMMQGSLDTEDKAWKKFLQDETERTAEKSAEFPDIAE